MSTLVTSVTPMQLMDSSTAASATTACNGNEERSASSSVISTAEPPFSTVNLTSVAQLSALGLSPQQHQQLPQTLTAVQAQIMTPVPYATNVANYANAQQHQQLRSQQQHHQQHQQQQQQHLLQAGFNAIALQQQHQQLMAGNMAAYHHAQQAQLQAQPQAQQCSLTPTSTSSTSQPNQTSVPPSTAAAPAAASNSINRSQRCGVCRGCQCKPCGVCTYCQDSPQFGGPGVKKQSCIERRCLRVLENRLQRDAPTFKARMGCNNCDDCKMPDCQICLVCLDRRFFQNRYMNGAICAKKRCNNATSLELSPQANNNNLPPSTDRNQQHLKRTYDNNNYDQVTVKRRGIEVLQQMHHQQQPQKQQQQNLELRHQHSARITPTSPHSLSPPSSNGSHHARSQHPQGGVASTTSVTINKNGIMIDISAQQLLQQQQMAAAAAQQFRNVHNGNVLSDPLRGSGIENNSADNYRDGAITANNVYTSTTAPSTTVSNDSAVLQQHQQLLQNGNYYITSPGYAFHTGSGVMQNQFDLAAAAAATTVPPTNSLVYQQYQQQQQLQSQLFCNTYMQQQQKFLNYPKYEYYDEHAAYGVLQNGNGGPPPPDPFVPPSYSEMKNAVVLQPL